MCALFRLMPLTLALTPCAPGRNVRILYIYIYIELMSADNAHRSYSYVAAPVLVRQLNTFSYVYVLFRFLSCCSLPRVSVFFSSHSHHLFVWPLFAPSITLYPSLTLLLSFSYIHVYFARIPSIPFDLNMMFHS